MARHCTTTAGPGVCCLAAQQGLLGRPFTIQDHLGHTRCAQCDAVPSTSAKHPGQPVFVFHFLGGVKCGLTSGCAANVQITAGSRAQAIANSRGGGAIGGNVFGNTLQLPNAAGGVPRITAQ